MDFSKVEEISIKEGNVKQVAVNGKTLWKKYLLPVEYTKLEYIQNDRDSYIKTGVLDGTDDLSYEADFTYISGSSYRYVLGAYSGDSFKNTVLYINLYGDIGGWVNKGYSASLMTPSIVSENQRIKCYADSTKFIVNGITKMSSDVGAQRDGAELYLFRRNGDDKSYAAQSTSNAIIKLHSLVIKIKNVAVRNFIPAMRNSDGEVGLYDTITKQFFTNAGTGKFIAGPRFVEHIEFDGNSYIDIDYIPSSNTRVVGKCSFTQWHPTPGANYVFGVFGEGANFGLNVGSSRNIMNVPWGTSAGINFNNDNNFGQVYSFDISNKGAYLDGVVKLTGSQLSETFTATKSFFVGWSNGTSTQKLVGNIYPMKIYENDVLVKDLRPCLDDNNVACLYDKVTGEYYYNKGTGKIGAGLPAEYTRLKYIETDGNAYIDTNILMSIEIEEKRKYKFEYKGVMDSDPIVSKYAVDGVGGAKTGFYVGISQDGKFGYFGDNDLSVGDVITANEPHIFTIDYVNGDAYLDGIKQISGVIPRLGTEAQTIGVFCYNSGSKGLSIHKGAKRYWVKLWKENVIILNLIPVIRNYDSVLGMYDTVTKQFFTNAGWGKFIAGPVAI